MRLSPTLRTALMAGFVLLVSACDGGADFSLVDLPPAPAVQSPPPAVVVTTPKIVASTYDTLQSNSNSPASIKATVDAIVAARDACGGCAVSVNVEGHADARGTTADNRLLSRERARDTAALIQAELDRRSIGGVDLNPVGLGESQAVASVKQCQDFPNSAQCVKDRATVVQITTSFVPPTAPPATNPPATDPSPTNPPATDPSPTSPPAPTPTPTPTTLPPTPGFTSSPVVQVPPYMQPNRTHTFSLTPVAVSCTSCVTPPSAGPAKSGWGQPSVSNVTFSGFSAASIKSPSGYTSPTYWEVKGYPNGTGNQNQSFQVAFKKATRAGEVYTLKPGSVTITVTYTPWLWDGSSLTWLPDRATAETKTFPVSCRYTATGSTSCSFKVLGTGIVG